MAETIANVVDQRGEAIRTVFGNMSYQSQASIMQEMSDRIGVKLNALQASVDGNHTLIVDNQGKITTLEGDVATNRAAIASLRADLLQAITELPNLQDPERQDVQAMIDAAVAFLADEIKIYHEGQRITPESAMQMLLDFAKRRPSGVRLLDLDANGLEKTVRVEFTDGTSEDHNCSHSEEMLGVFNTFKSVASFDAGSGASASVSVWRKRYEPKTVFLGEEVVGLARPAEQIAYQCAIENLSLKIHDSDSSIPDPTEPVEDPGLTPPLEP